MTMYFADDIEQMVNEADNPHGLSTGAGFVFVDEDGRELQIAEAIKRDNEDDDIIRLVLKRS